MRKMSTVNVTISIRYSIIQDSKPNYVCKGCRFENISNKCSTTFIAGNIRNVGYVQH